MKKKFTIYNLQFTIKFIVLIFTFYIVPFTFFPSSVFAQTPCNQVPTSTWRGNTTYDLCNPESCNNGTWSIYCYSSVNSNCVGTYSGGACSTTSSSTTSTSTTPDCSVNLTSKSLEYRNVDGNNVILLSPNKSIINSTSSSVYFTAMASSNCSIKYMFNLYYWSPDNQKWLKTDESSWQSSNYITMNMDSGVRQYSAGFGVSACNSKGCDTKWDWIQFWYMQVDPARPISASSQGVLSGNIIAPDYIPIFGPKIPNTSGYYNPTYYLLYGEDPAIRANQLPDTKEVEIPAKYISWSSETGSPTYRITFSINNYSIPNLQNGKTYYFRLRQHGTGTDGYIPGPASGFVSTRPNSTPPVVDLTISPQDPKATDDISITPDIQSTAVITESYLYLDGNLMFGCSTSAPNSCGSGGISGVRLNAGSHTYKLVVTDQYNNATTKEGSFSVKSSFSISHSPTQPDSTSNVSYSASGIGVSNIKIFVDGTLVKNCDGLSCLFTAGPYAINSTHTYYATATDALGATIQDPPSGTKSFSISSAPVAVDEQITHNDFGEGNPFISCAGENFCMATWNKTTRSADHDWAIATLYYAVWNGSSWSSPAVFYSSTNYGGGPRVSCLSSSNCLVVWQEEAVAVGSDYMTFSYANWNGSSWSQATKVTPANTHDFTATVSCAGSSCLVLWRRDSSGKPYWWQVQNQNQSIYYARWSGSSLSTPTVFASNPNAIDLSWEAVSCVSDSFCMFSWLKQGSDFQTYPQISIWNGSTWTTKQEVLGSDHLGGAIASNITCSSNSYCISIGPAGGFYWNGTSWSSIGSGATSYGNVSCNLTVCLMSLGYGYYTVYKQNSPFQSGNFDHGNYYADVSCPSSNVCLAITSYGSGSSSEIYFQKINPSVLPSPAPSPSPLPSPSPSPSPSPVSSPSSIPSPSPVSSANPNPSTPPATPCTITSASWGQISTSSVLEGTNLTLNVQSNGDCSGKQVGFKIKEDDGIFGSQDVNINPAPVAFSANSASTTWVGEYQCDGFMCLNDPPEYYFEANIVGDSGTFRSLNPEIQVNKATALTGPNTINGFVYIDANKNGSRDLSEKCYVGEVKVSISLSGKTPITYTQDADCNTSYKFENLPNGTYTINIQPISGVESTNQTPWQQVVTVP